MESSRIKLSACAEIFSGYSFRQLPPNEPEGSYVLVQPRDWDAVAGRWSYDNALRMMEFPGDDRHFLRKGDILVSGKGKTTPIITFEASAQKMVASAAFIIVRPSLLKASPDFLAWYLQLPVAQQYLYSTKAGATVLNLSVKAVQDMEISLPSLEMQTRIGRLHRALLEKKATQLELMEKERKLVDHSLYIQVNS